MLPAGELENPQGGIAQRAMTSTTPVPRIFTSSSSADTREVLVTRWHAEMDRFTAVLESAAGIRGAGVAALARHLHLQRRSIAPLDALELSVQLLAVETDETCEALTTLLGDGWDGGLGALLSCARQL
jgi:hypothetical protein